MRDGERRGDADAQGEAEAPGEAGHDDGGEQREDERRLPVARWCTAAATQEDDLGDDREQAPDVAPVADRPGGAEDRVEHEDDAPDGRSSQRGSSSCWVARASEAMVVPQRMARMAGAKAATRSIAVEDADAVVVGRAVGGLDQLDDAVPPILAVVLVRKQDRTTQRGEVGHAGRGRAGARLVGRPGGRRGAGARVVLHVIQIGRDEELLTLNDRRLEGSRW